ncbi:MAG: hypothetical protein A2078_05995 [Nitrospirae bacterium GWC2_57_9]|nr:MAG: hypothetical protein A2078_05995 [Nitrospirae bacterium GWC2_57_9]
MRLIAFKPALWPVLLFLASSLLPAGCSVPRVIILHDPLTAEDHEQLGRIYEGQGKSDLAVVQYQEAVKKDRKRVSSLLLLGDLSFRISDYVQAESAYRQAIDLDPGNGDVRNNLAWVYIRTGRKLEIATEHVIEAMKLNPAHRPFYLDTLGVILLKQGNAGDAVTALKEAVATLPGDDRELLSQAQGHLADACRAAGNDGCYYEAVKHQRDLFRKPD